MSAAWHDPDTRGHLKQAASSLAAALGSTISGLGDELRRTHDVTDPSGKSNVTDLAGEEPIEKGGTGSGVVHGDREPAATDEGEL